MPSASEVDILDRVIEPGRPTLSAEAAQSILNLAFKQEDLDRMNQLAEKARDGSLTPEEQADIESYERIGHFLSLVKSKARVSLKNTSSAS